jgi:hypothetical protein
MVQASRLQATQDAVAGHVRESILYGDPKSIAAIRRAAEGVAALARQGPEILGDAQIAANMRGTRAVLLDAAEDVAAAGRKHLGLEDLPIRERGVAQVAPGQGDVSSGERP